MTAVFGRKERIHEIVFVSKMVSQYIDKEYILMKFSIECCKIWETTEKP